MNTTTPNNENIIFQTGQHPVVFLRSIVIACIGALAAKIAIICITFFLVKIIFPLFQFPQAINISPEILTLSNPIIIGAIALYFFNIFLNFRFSKYTITTKNLIIRYGYGLLSRESINFARTNLLTLEVEQPLLGRILNYGSISVNMMNKPYSFQYVANPQQLLEHFRST